MSTDRAEGMDGLQSDMAEHQRRFNGGKVTPLENQSLAAHTFAQIDRERAEAKPEPTPEPAVPQHTRETVEREHGKYIVDKSPTDDVKFRPASKMEHEWFVRAQPRVTLLLSKPETGPLGQPSWRQRTLSVLKYGLDAKDHRIAGNHEIAGALMARYVFELEQLLDASSASFGDWRKLQPQVAA